MDVPKLLVTTYLQMTNISQFNPAYLEDCKNLNVMRMEELDLEFYRFLYGSVGKEWKWCDRLLLSDEELATILINVNVHVLYLKGVPAGYIELAPTDTSTEIAYFGLRSSYTGKGLGKHLLSLGISQAWEEGATHLWVHTCNLDSPYALDNYLKRGFSIYKIEEEPLPKRYL